MKQSPLLLAITTVILLLVGVVTIALIQNVDAAVIKCQVGAGTCPGTAEDDVMTGTEGFDIMGGLGGNDRLVGLGTSDVIYGGDGNDVILSEEADVIFGGTGADTIKGSTDSDTICHGDANFFIACSTDSDGSRDRIDCGTGQVDRARINTSVDKDVAVNCDIVQAG